MSTVKQISQLCAGEDGLRIKILSMKNYLMLVGIFNFSLILFVNGCASQHESTNTVENISAHICDDFVLYEQKSKISSGSDFIVMRKDSLHRKNGPDRKNAVLILKNQNSAFFINIFETCLFMDYGTGPDARMLKIYNIERNALIVDTIYSDTIGRVNDTLISIWLESNDTTFSKCEEYQIWKDNGLSAAIIEQHYFNLKTFQLFKTENWKCEVRQ